MRLGQVFRSGATAWQARLQALARPHRRPRCGRPFVRGYAPQRSFTAPYPARCSHSIQVCIVPAMPFATSTHGELPTRDWRRGPAAMRGASCQMAVSDAAPRRWTVEPRTLRHGTSAFSTRAPSRPTLASLTLSVKSASFRGRPESMDGEQRPVGLQELHHHQLTQLLHCPTLQLGRRRHWEGRTFRPCLSRGDAPSAARRCRGPTPAGPTWLQRASDTATGR